MPKDMLFEDEPTVGVKPAPGPDVMTPTGVDEMGTMPGESRKATSAEQAQYVQIMLRSGEIIHGTASDTLIEKMNNPNVPVHEAVGDVAAMIAKTVVQSMKAAGEEPDVEAVLTAGQDYVIPQLFEIGQVAKVIPQMPQEEEQEEMKLALLHAESVYGNQLAREGGLPTDEARAVLDEQFRREGEGYSIDQFLSEAGADGSGQSFRQPADGPPSQLKPLANFVQNKVAGDLV
jgi:hypothetical protein